MSAKPVVKINHMSTALQEFSIATAQVFRK